MDRLTQLLQDMGVTSTRDEPIVTSTRDMPVGIDDMPEPEPTSILDLGDNMDIITQMLFGTNAGGGGSNVVTLMRAYERTRNQREALNNMMAMGRQRAQQNPDLAMHGPFIHFQRVTEQGEQQLHVRQNQINFAIEDYVNFFNMLRVRNHLPTIPANVIRNTLQSINPRRRTQ